MYMFCTRNPLPWEKCEKIFPLPVSSKKWACARREVILIYIQINKNYEVSFLTCAILGDLIFTHPKYRPDRILLKKQQYSSPQIIMFAAVYDSYLTSFPSTLKSAFLGYILLLPSHHLLYFSSGSFLWDFPTKILDLVIPCLSLPSHIPSLQYLNNTT